MSPTRIERDSMGEMQVPAEALYGAQTQRAVQNFQISGPMPTRFIAALLRQKQAAARANAALGLLPTAAARAIEEAATELLAQPDFMRHFPVDVFQTGSGTSSNMNTNEVLATLATRRLRAQGGELAAVSANDHVNMGQSSNDAIPSALHIAAALALHQELLPALRGLARAIRAKSASDGHHVKTGRTHLMDAMPVRLGQVLDGWAAQIEAQIEGLQTLQPRMQTLAQGGTAVGTGINAHPDFAPRFAQEISALTGLHFRPAPDFFAAMGSQDAAVALSGALKALAVSLMKIANDLRWMNSGPLAGLAEIELEALQPGSSIMPGKVNPVIPEVVNQIAFEVIGNDMTVTFAAEAGQLQLNAFEPIIAHSLFKSVLHLSKGCVVLADRCVDGITANRDALRASVERSIGIVTALNPYIGYAHATDVAAEAHASGRGVAEIVLERGLMTAEALAEVLRPEVLTRPRALPARKLA